MNGFLKISIILFSFLPGISPAIANDQNEQLDTANDLYDMQLYGSAHKLLLPLAEEGNTEAQFRIGSMYLQGKGVTKDINEAIKWYRKAAEQDYELAQLVLGAMYQQGSGIAQDSKESFKWYQKAAEQGNADAQHNLGYMYQEGIGVPQDFKAAFGWYFKAAIQGKPQSQFNLAMLYAHGHGTERNGIDAYAWAYIASKSGLETPVEALNAIEQDSAVDAASIEMGRERATEIISQYKLK